MSITLDWARADEADRLAELFHADMVELGLAPNTQELRALVRGLLEVPRELLFLRVARDEAGIAVGVLLANAFYSIKFPGRAWWIEELYVAPEARRMGVGRLLVDDLLGYAHTHGFKGVELEAYRMNTAASILYRSLGFRRLARERYTFDLSEWEP